MASHGLNFIPKVRGSELFRNVTYACSYTLNVHAYYTIVLHLFNTTILNEYIYRIVMTPALAVKLGT